MSEYDPHYDRGAASAILARLAEPGLFGGGSRLSDDALGGVRRITYVARPMIPEADSHLTLAQRLYLNKCMQPCTPGEVGSATHRIGWTDSEGVVSTGHARLDGLGPVVPIAVRETVLALWRDVAANHRLAAAALRLSEDDFAVLSATTTDVEPIEIIRIGIEATGRAVAQHALIAHHVGIDSAADLAREMESSGLFGIVASSWYWELQASTYRRGMIPVTLQWHNKRLRYTPATMSTLAEMKRRTVAEAHDVMTYATTEEGLTPAEAVAKYHTDLDRIAKQYALLDPATPTRCLALPTATVAGRRFSVLAEVVGTFVDAFSRMMDRLELVEVAPQPVLDGTGEPTREQFAVPDMNCRHCRLTVRAVLESYGAQVFDVNLITKQVWAQFDTTVGRASAFEALRASGYTVAV